MAKHVVVKWIENRGLTPEQINEKRVAGGFEPVDFSVSVESAKPETPVAKNSVTSVTGKESVVAAAGGKVRWRAPFALEVWLVDFVRNRKGLFSKDHYEALELIKKDHHDDWFIVNGSELTLQTLRVKLVDAAKVAGVKVYDVPYQEKPEGVAPKSNQTVGTEGIRAMVERSAPPRAEDPAVAPAASPVASDPRDLMVTAIVDAIISRVRMLERDRKYQELLALYEMLLK